MTIILFNLLLILLIFDAVCSIYISYKNWKLTNKREVIIKDLNKFNAAHKKSLNNSISYHAVASDVGRSRTDKKEEQTIFF